MKYKLIFLTAIIFFTANLSVFSRPKVALVLSGGGANGLAEIPLLEAIEEEGIDVDFVVGVSMGAILGSLYSSGYSPKQIREIMTTLDIVGIINQSASQTKSLPPIPDNPFYSNLYSFDFSKKGFGSQPGLLGDQKITNMLARFLSKTSQIKDFDKLPKPFRSISTDVFTGKTIISDSGSIVSAVRGSMAVPVVFSPFPTENGSLAYDGGLSNNLPIQIAKEMGADVVIAMDVLAKIGVNQEDFGSIDSNFIQSINLIISMKTLNQYKDADILIQPDLSAISAGKFGSAKEIIQIGEEAVNKSRSQIHELAQKLKNQGFELKKMDYDRKSVYDSMGEPIISSIKIKDISAGKTNGSIPIPKPADLSYFMGKRLNEKLSKKLIERLEQLRYSYNLATLTFEFEDNEISEENTGNERTLVILANHYSDTQNRLFIGGRPALQCYFTDSETPSFVMFPFFTAGVIIQDTVPFSFTFSSDKYFSGNIKVQPVISKTKNRIFSAGGEVFGKYGSLHPVKTITYSTKLTDDDYGFGANLNFNAQFMEVMNGECGLEYDFSHLNTVNTPSTTDSFNHFSGYLQFAADTLQSDVSGFSGLRIDTKIKAGLDISGNFFYCGKAFIIQQFEVLHEKTSLGYMASAFTNSYPSELIQGYYDAGGYYGMSGYEYGNWCRNGLCAGLTWKQKLFSPFDMPVILITQIKGGIFDGTFDFGTSLHIGLKTPFGSLLFGGGYSFLQKKCCLTFTLM